MNLNINILDIPISLKLLEFDFNHSKIYKYIAIYQHPYILFSESFQNK